MNEEQKHAARMVLGHYNHPEGIRGGGFTEALLNAWDKADLDNQARLEGAFPEFAPAMIRVYIQGVESLAEHLRS